MRLFDVLPERFFALLASPNRAFYAEAVMLLYEQYQANQFGIPFDVLRDALQELIETQEASGLSYRAEEDDDLQDSGGGGGSGEGSGEGGSEQDVFRAKASAMLRRLKSYGWMDIEERANYQRFVVLPLYSSRILETLKDLCVQRAVEYQSFAFVTYSLLSGDEAKRRPAYAIMEAAETTRRFVGALRELANNMKHHMEEIATKTSLQEVLDYHFDEYKTKIVDRSYHRLKTSDHVSRYRQRILATVENWLLDDDLFGEIVLSSVREGNPEAQAEQDLRTALYYIDDAYRHLDDTLNQIDLRHNQYLRASFDRARYLGQYSYGLDHRLGQLLEWLSHHKDEGAGPLFPLISLRQLSDSALYTPRKRREPLKPQTHITIPMPAELRQQQRDLNLSRIQNAITREKIGQYVLQRMAERDEMDIVELAPHTLEEYIYLAFVFLHGTDGSLGYRIARDSSVSITLGDYTFSGGRVLRTHPKGGRRAHA